MLDGDEADLGEHLEVVGDGGLSDADLLDDVPDGHGCVGGEQVQDLDTGGSARQRIAQEASSPPTRPTTIVTLLTSARLSGVGRSTGGVTVRVACCAVAPSP